MYKVSRDVIFAVLESNLSSMKLNNHKVIVVTINDPYEQNS